MICEYLGGKFINRNRSFEDFEGLSKSLWSHKFHYGASCCFVFTSGKTSVFGAFDNPQPSVDEAEQLYALLSEFISHNGDINSFTIDAYGQNTQTLQKYYFTIQFTKKKNKLYHSLLAFNVIVDRPTGDSKEIQKTVNKKPEVKLCEENSPLKSTLGRVLDLLK